ncbi:hypothetical protein AcV5_002275 [Taiwanofungus camphoratus]|nr:hypothetical protein AcV5_002275 [Antrodia cinnamomea]KAI0944164.1 hypothetical protein AcV7_002066 [Antrodia cinnamomea]
MPYVSKLWSALASYDIRALNSSHLSRSRSHSEPHCPFVSLMTYTYPPFVAYWPRLCIVDYTSVNSAAKVHNTVAIGALGYSEHFVCACVLARGGWLDSSARSSRPRLRLSSDTVDASAGKPQLQ